MRRSYHLWTEDWPDHYTYDPDNPPLWDDGGCAFHGADPHCPGTADDRVIASDPEDADHLLHAHTPCLDRAFGDGGWRPTTIPYDEFPSDDLHDD